MKDSKRNLGSSEHDRLKKAFDNAVTQVGEAVKRFPWEDRDAYAFWLSQTYRLVSHTSTLIATCAGKIGTANLARHRELLAHLRDETGHELFAKRDLEALGLSLDHYPELVATSVIYQAQYFRVERTEPLGLFGYALLLEGVASTAGPSLYERAVSAHGAKACAFLDLHARADQTHYPQGVEWLTTFTPEAQRSALENLRQSMELYPAMLEAILRAVRAGRPAIRRAA